MGFCLSDALIQHGDPVVQQPVVVHGGTGPALQVGTGEAEGTHGIHTGLLRRHMAQQQEVVEILVSRGIEQLGQLRSLRHRSFHGRKLRLGGDGAEHEGDAVTHLCVQRHVQRQPGGEGSLLYQQLSLLGVEGGHGLFSLQNAAGGFQTGGIGLVVEQLLFAQLGALTEQSSLGFAVFL